MSEGDKTLSCVDCKGGFIWTVGEQTFYQEKNLQEPKRCSDCRQARRVWKESIKDDVWGRMTGAMKEGIKNV